MEFLLAAVNAKYIHSNPAIYSLRAYARQALEAGNSGEMHKEGTGAAAGEQREASCSVRIELAEYTINQQLQEILSDLYLRRPEAVGFSCYIWNWRMIQELIEELHKLLPETDIWLGGPEVSYAGEEIYKQFPYLAGIFVGEGEATFRDVVAYYEERNQLRECKDGVESAPNARKQRGRENGALSKIPGLYLPTGFTAPREPLNLDELPFLYEDLEPFTNRIIYYESSRGCPYSCSYCLSSIDKSVRFRNREIVKQELQFFLDKQVAQVKFVDRTFNCNHDHAMEIWKYLKDHDNGVTNFHFEIAANLLKDEEITLLNSLRPGLVQLEIGVQTTNPQTLEAIHRRMDVEELAGIVKALQKGNNIHLHLDLIAGLPYEDYESFGNSFNRVYGMEPEQLQLGFLKVLKGSYMQEKAKEYGLVYGNRPPYEVLYTKWLSYEDVIRLKQVEEVLELYYNSGQYPHTLKQLVRAFDTPFQMYEQMADYFREQGYFLNSPSRAYRYQVLFDFACKYDGARTEMYRELLLFDMYLRENLKSRPDFAQDAADQKEFLRDFYRKEEEERRYLPDYQGYDWKQLSKMTHLEYFRYPLEGYVLFDYQNRNPLTYQAQVTIVAV